LSARLFLRPRAALAAVVLAPAAWAALTLLAHLVHLLVDALVDLGLLLVGLVGGETAGRDRLVDALLRGVLQRVGDIGRVLAVGLGDLGQRLAGQLLPQLVGRNANGLGRRGEVRARGKLRGSDVKIENVWGRGYRLVSSEQRAAS
jgi:hypothetical protein